MKNKNLNKSVVFFVLYLLNIGLARLLFFNSADYEEIYTCSIFVGLLVSFYFMFNFNPRILCLVFPIYYFICCIFCVALIQSWILFISKSSIVFNVICKSLIHNTILSFILLFPFIIISFFEEVILFKILNNVIKTGKNKAENGDASAFHIGRNMDGEAELVSSVKGNDSVDSSGESVTQNAFLAKSEENATDYSESSGNRIEGYYYFINYMNDFEKNETRYSASLRNLNVDWLATRKKLSQSYYLKENRNLPYSKLISLTIYNGLFPIGVLSVMYKGYSTKIPSISSVVDSARGIHVFEYVGEV